MNEQSLTPITVDYATKCGTEEIEGGGGHGWEDNIKINHKEIGLEGVGWNSSSWEPVAVSCEHGNEPSGSIKCREFLQ
jgi:hypothetical protein